MKNRWVLFGCHVVFWLALVSAASFNASPMVTVFGKQLPVESLFVMLAVPVLLVCSWQAGRDAPSRWLKNYFVGFRWLGSMFWILALCLTWRCLRVSSQAQNIVNTLLPK